MKNEIQSKLDEYVEIVEQVRQKMNSDEIAIGVLHELCKDQRMECMRHEVRRPAEEPATAKQKRLLRELKVRYPKDISKLEASQLIDENIETK